MSPLMVGVHVSNQGSVLDSIEVAVAADRGGADVIWVSEDLYFHGAVPLAAVIASRTSSAAVGFSVLTPYGHHPARLAMDLSTLAALAPGRLIFGVGAGVRPRIEHMGATWVNPVELVRTIAETTTALLRGEQLTSDHPAALARDLRLSIDPPAGALPVYVAAVGPKALTQAGRLFDGVVLSLMAAAPHLEMACRLVAEGAGEAGRDGCPVIATVPVRIAGDSTVAVARAQRLVAFLMSRWAPTPSLRKLFTTDGLLSDDQFQRFIDRLHRGGDPLKVLDPAVARAHCPAGTADEVAEQLRDFSRTGISGVNIDLGTDEGPGAVEPVVRMLIDRLRAEPAPASTSSMTIRSGR